VGTSTNQIVKGVVEEVAEDDRTKKYLTLLELSRAVASRHELPELFHDLACRLHDLFDLSHLGIFLHDGLRNVMRLHLLETCDPAQWQAPTEIPLEGSIAGSVWQHQEPIIVRDLELETRFQIKKTLHNHPVKSISVFPLTTDKRLGVVAFWSEKVGAYDGLDLEFTKLVAAHIAVAVEAQFHQQKLARERDRSRLLLEINNTLVSNLNLRELISAISACLSRVIPHDAAGLALYDPAINKLRVTALEFPTDENVFIEGEIVDLDDTPPARAFITRQPVISNQSNLTDIGRRVGTKSDCAIPLIAHDRVLGILGVGSFKENAFTDDDAELLAGLQDIKVRPSLDDGKLHYVAKRPSGEFVVQSNGQVRQVGATIADDTTVRAFRERSERNLFFFASPWLHSAQEGR